MIIYNEKNFKNEKHAEKYYFKAIAILPLDLMHNTAHIN